MHGIVPRIVLWVGIVLVVIGLGGRYVIGLRGVTSLIPALFGLPIALLGYSALDQHYFRSSMRSVAVLSLLGMLVTLHVLPLLGGLLRGEQPPDHPASILARSAMLLLCGVLLIICSAALARIWLQQRRS